MPDVYEWAAGMVEEIERVLALKPQRSRVDFIRSAIDDKIKRRRKRKD